ncbi:MAG TPA: LptA/OstA family protein [Pseudolabrys sp.]|nr:LptA/OstA family protein [Pseudolabrys sp.]
MNGFDRLRLLAFSIAILASPPLAAAQTQGPPNALQGFSQNRDQPVHIEAATLEVRDKDQVATFSGNVHVTQGDTGLRCKSLVVYYEQNAKDQKPAPATAAKGGMKQAEPGPTGQQQIKRLEAKGGVIVTQKEQTATGDSGIFDMRSNTVTLLGNVVMTQGPNVLRGEKLIVDLTSGVSRVEGGKGVQALINPGSAPQAPGAAKPEAGAKPAAPQTRAHPGAPMRLN